MLEINYEYIKGVLFVRVNGKLTKNNSYKLRNYLPNVIMKHGIKYMVYNFYNLEDIDETGVNTLLCGIKAIEDNKGNVYMCEVPKKLENKLNKININNSLNELSVVELFNI